MFHYSPEPLFCPFGLCRGTLGTSAHFSLDLILRVVIGRVAIHSDSPAHSYVHSIGLHLAVPKVPCKVSLASRVNSSSKLESNMKIHLPTTEMNASINQSINQLWLFAASCVQSTMQPSLRVWCIIGHSKNMATCCMVWRPHGVILIVRV